MVASMNILITDVTEIQAGNYCVASDAASGQMIRPLPGKFRLGEGISSRVDWTEQRELLGFDAR